MFVLVTSSFSFLVVCDKELALCIYLKKWTFYAFAKSRNFWSVREIVLTAPGRSDQFSVRELWWESPLSTDSSHLSFSGSRAADVYLQLWLCERQGSSRTWQTQFLVGFAMCVIYFLTILQQPPRSVTEHWYSNNNMKTKEQTSHVRVNATEK